MDNYYLYIDDERNPKTDKGWVIVRSFESAIACIRERGMPIYLSFDHDLGTRLTGYDIAKWLVEQDLDKTLRFPKGFEFNVHSANVVGARNITEYLNGYLKYKNTLWG